MTQGYCRRAGFALAGLIACAAAGADPQEAVKNPPQKIALHRLENKELLAQAAALLEKASGTHAAQL